MNLAVNKKAIISALWKGKGSETPFSYYYYPFHKGYSADWKIPPYDPSGRRSSWPRRATPADSRCG